MKTKKVEFSHGDRPGSLPAIHVSMTVFDGGDHISSVIEKSGGFYEQKLLRMLDGMKFSDGLIGDGVFVDAGANIGNHSLFALNVLGMPVIAFEPNEDVHRILSQNIPEGMISHRPLWSEVGGGMWVTRLSSTNHGMVAVNNRKGDEEAPRSTTIDAEIGQRHHVSLIKVDVEGGEENVLRGAWQTITDSFPVIVFECAAADGAFDDRKHKRIMRFLEQCGDGVKVIHCGIVGATPTAVVRYAISGAEAEKRFYSREKFSQKG